MWRVNVANLKHNHITFQGANTGVTGRQQSKSYINPRFPENVINNPRNRTVTQSMVSYLLLILYVFLLY